MSVCKAHTSFCSNEHFNSHFCDSPMVARDSLFLLRLALQLVLQRPEGLILRPHHPDALLGGSGGRGAVGEGSRTKWEKSAVRAEPRRSLPRPSRQPHKALSPALMSTVFQKHWNFFHFHGSFNTE